MAPDPDRTFRTAKWGSQEPAPRQLDGYGAGPSGHRDGRAQAPVRVADDRFRCRVLIANEMGLHARPASLLVGLSNKFNCDVTIQKEGEQLDEKPVDGKSILQLLSLSAEAGTALILETHGADAEAAIEALCRLISSGFNERGSIEVDGGV